MQGQLLEALAEEAEDPLMLMTRTWLQVSAEVGADHPAETKAVPEVPEERLPLLPRQLAELAEGGAAEAEAHSYQNPATQMS